MLFIDIIVVWVQILDQIPMENWSNQDPFAMVISDHLSLYPSQYNLIEEISHVFKFKNCSA